MLAFVLENLDTSLKTPDDVRRALHLPTLGVVPDFAALSLGYGRRALTLPTVNAGGELAAPKGEIVGLLHDHSVPAEAYRSIRTSILFCNPAQPPRSLLITSSQPGEGKTATTVNLAISLAQLGNRVIVVDADLRQPRCHRALGIPLGRGLTEVLRDGVPLDDVIQQLSLDGNAAIRAEANGTALNFLQSGAPPAHPSELLASARMRETLQLLLDRYDMVLVDSPPVFPITDAAILAAKVDGVVLVVRGQRTERQITREALERLRFMNATVVGVVLNAVDPGSSDYYRYPYYFASEDVA
jgi:capsular exopolysaccharide synthesis family protein